MCRFKLRQSARIITRKVKAGTNIAVAYGKAFITCGQNLLPDVQRFLVHVQRIRIAPGCDKTIAEVVVGICKDFMDRPQLLLPKDKCFPVEIFSLAELAFFVIIFPQAIEGIGFQENICIGFKQSQGRLKLIKSAFKITLFQKYIAQQQQRFPFLQGIFVCRFPKINLCFKRVFFCVGVLCSIKPHPAFPEQLFALVSCILLTGRNQQHPQQHCMQEDVPHIEAVYYLYCLKTRWV